MWSGERSQPSNILFILRSTATPERCGQVNRSACGGAGGLEIGAGDFMMQVGCEYRMHVELKCMVADEVTFMAEMPLKKESTTGSFPAQKQLLLLDVMCLPAKSIIIQVPGTE